MGSSSFYGTLASPSGLESAEKRAPFPVNASSEELSHLLESDRMVGETLKLGWWHVANLPLVTPHLIIWPQVVDIP